jgi:LCP family protein required for cell wall assembly
MPDERPSGAPEYKVYRSRRRLLDRLRPRDDLRALRERLRKRPPGRPGEPRPRARRAVTVRRVLKWLGVALTAWLVLSLLLFMVSAQLEGGVSDGTESALSDGGNLLTGSTILVLGSDERPRLPGAGPGRADSIMLLRVGFGSVRKLSILRDSYVEIPGHGRQKINAAYAIGGPALMIETVEAFLGNGVEINHVVELNFQDFPDLIDALGGIDITIRRCIRSQEFEGRVFRLRKGTHRLNGREALRFARVRRNFCSPGEDDRARARRQQQVFAAIRDRLLSPAAFVRLPWVSWEAPKTLRSDMHGPGLLGLFTDLLTGGAGETRVLRPSSAGPGGSVIVSEQEKASEVGRLLG